MASLSSCYAVYCPLYEFFLFNRFLTMAPRRRSRAARGRPITLTAAQLRRIVRAVREGLEPRRTTLTFIPYPVFTEAYGDVASPITAPAHPVPQMVPTPVVAQQSVENRECYYGHVVGRIARDCPHSAVE